jgi:hypothetical protein
MEEEKRYPPSIRLIARAFEVEPAQVGPMFVRWYDEDGLTYQQMADRLHAKGAGLSASRVAELTLEAKGTDRPPVRPRPWRSKEEAQTA